MDESNLSKNNLKISKINTKKNSEEKFRDDQDKYCWICHKDKCNISCQICPRSYHTKCINNNNTYSHLDSLNLSGSKKSILSNNWICVECELIVKSKSTEGKSDSLKRLTKEEFSDLLKYALTTIKQLCDITFHTPVNLQIFKDYSNFIVHPMDFYKIEQYISTKKYVSTESFLSDCKWILHNCYIYNQAQNPLTINARYMLKIAKNEMYEIETCPDCFKNYYIYGSKDFFVQTCSFPHNLVFAKLKGHPLWPSKVVKLNQEANEVEVRFFGAHDKAFINCESCFLIHEKSFNMSKVAKNQKSKLETALKELKTHIEILNKNYPGLFKYSPPKTSFKPEFLYLIKNPHFNIISKSQTDKIQIIDKDSSIDLSNSSKDNFNDETTSKNEDLENDILSIKSSNDQNLSKNEDSINKMEIEDSKNFDNLSNLEDSDENDHKLVIDDTKRKKKRSLNRKLPENTNLIKNKITSNISKRKIECNLTPNSINKKVEENIESSIPSLPKKKLKKSKTDLLNTTPEIKTSLNNNKDKNILVENLSKQIQELKDELERSRTLHIAEIREMYINHKNELKELQANKDKALKEVRNELEAKFNKELDESKRKKWCNFCPKEANYFCCHISSYCSYSCQSKDWPQHMARCLQGKNSETTTASTNLNDDKLVKDDEISSKLPLNVDLNISSKNSNNLSFEDVNNIDLNTINKNEIEVNVNNKNDKNKLFSNKNETNDFITKVKKENEHFPEKPKDRFIKKLNENNLKAHKAEIERKNEKEILEKYPSNNILKLNQTESLIDNSSEKFKDRSILNFNYNLKKKINEKVNLNEDKIFVEQNLKYNYKSNFNKQNTNLSNEVQNIILKNNLGKSNHEKIVFLNNNDLNSWLDTNEEIKKNETEVCLSHSINEGEILSEISQLQNELLNKVENRLKLEESTI